MEEIPAQVNVSRKEILPAFFAVFIGAIILYSIMNAVQPFLMNNRYIFAFNDLIAGCIQGSFFYKVMWLFVDLTEGSFMASVPAAILMCIMAFVAASLEKKKSIHAGTGVDGNSRIFTRMFIAAITSLILGQLIYGSFFSNGWIPTFAAVLSVQVFVMFYGATPAKLITETLVGTVLTFPVCCFMLEYIAKPLGVPLFVAISLAIFVIVPVCSWIFKLMPWMMQKDSVPDQTVTEVTTTPVPSPTRFFVNRVFGDIGELTMWGSSLATFGMYIGAIISWLMNPLNPCYGAGILPLMIFAQIVTAALAIFIWYPRWKKNGWAFTFVGIVFVSAILITFPSHWLVVIPTIIIGAVVFAPLAEWVLKIFRYNGQFHPIAYLQLGISFVCIAWSLFLRYVLLPVLG